MSHVALVRSLVLCSIVVLGAPGVAMLGGGCKKPAASQTDEVKGPALPDVGKILPSSFAAPDCVGAQACAECHRAIYDKWQRSPHGRSMAEASPDTVLANFDGGHATLSDGMVSFSKAPDGFFMDMQSAWGKERRKVDLVLASGRQHQIYVAKGADGMLSLLPVVWSTKTKEWLPLSLYQPSDLDPSSPRYWGSKDMTRGCVTCHLSGAYRRVEPGHVENAWIDLSINCESCHGAGREHIRLRRAGSTDEVYRDFKHLGSVEESRVCGQCHGLQLKRYVFPPAEDGLPQIFVTSLIYENLRPDGTEHLTSYQYPAHVLSAGFSQKILTCKDCHAPHGLEARNNQGESAVGELSNKQCTGCHEDLIAPKKVTAHSRHPGSVRCVDCHMSYSWIGDDEKRHQRTSDHSISIPHPQESIDLGTPNACTTCHKERTSEWSLAALKKWGMDNATGVREWVETIAQARKIAPGATGRLLRLLEDKNSGSYLKASALDYLDIQPPDAAAITAITPYATGEDPNLRASAIRALDHHDPDGRKHWRELGLADAHPYVRMEIFSMIKEVETLAPAAIERNLADVLAYMSPPNDGLVHLITVRHRRGELREALALIDLLERVATPRERSGLNLESVRARLNDDIAKRK